MRFLASLRRWFRWLFDINAHRTSTDFLWRACYIALSLATFFGSVLAYVRSDISLLWMVPTTIAVVVATANGVWPFCSGRGSDLVDVDSELGLIAFLLIFLAVPALLFVSSPVVLVWTLLRALRAAKLGLE